MPCANALRWRRYLGPKSRRVIRYQQVLRGVEHACSLDAAQQQRFTRARRLCGEELEFKERGKWRKALPLLREACEVCDDVMGADSVFTAMYFQHLGTLERDLELYKEAKISLSHALQARVQFTEDADFENASLTQVLATVCIGLGEFEEAEAYTVRSDSILKGISGSNEQAHAAVRLTYARIYNRTGRCKQAERLLRDVLQDVENSERKTGLKLQNDHLTCQVELADSLVGQEKYEEAEAIYERLEDVFEKLGGVREQSKLATWKRVLNPVQKLCVRWAARWRPTNTLERPPRSDRHKR